MKKPYLYKTLTTFSCTASSCIFRNCNDAISYDFNKELKFRESTFYHTIRFGEHRLTLVLFDRPLIISSQQMQFSTNKKI